MTASHGGYEQVLDEAGEQRYVPVRSVCPTVFPEPHELGEFSGSCYACHVEADS